MSEHLPVVRCAIYTRDLSEYGPDDLDPDAQYEACRAYIEARAIDNWVMVRSRYHDGKVAGTSLKRPRLSDLQGQIEIGAIDRLVVHKLKHLTPSFKDLSIFQMFMTYGQCSLVAAGMDIDTSTPRGQQIVGMLSQLRGFENGLVGERVVLNRKPSQQDIAAVLRITAQLRANNAEKEVRPYADAPHESRSRWCTRGGASKVRNGRKLRPLMHVSRKTRVKREHPARRRTKL